MRRHLYFYTLIDQSLSEATALIQGDPTRWLPAPAEQINGGFAVDLIADGALPPTVARHRVIVTVGTAVDAGERLLRPVSWRSSSAPGLFPVLEADLELVPLQSDVCQLSLFGTYRPPLSVAGGAGDALVGHRVAEACVRRFVLDTAERMAGVTLDV